MLGDAKAQQDDKMLGGGGRIVEKPTFNDLTLAYPADALAKRLSGQVRLKRTADKAGART